MIYPGKIIANSKVKYMDLHRVNKKVFFGEDNILEMTQMGDCSNREDIYAQRSYGGSVRWVSYQITPSNTMVMEGLYQEDYPQNKISHFQKIGIICNHENFLPI